MISKIMSQEADQFAKDQWESFHFSGWKDLAAACLEFGEKMVAREREACAKLIEDDNEVKDDDHGASHVLLRISKRIRDRGNP